MTLPLSLSFFKFIMVLLPMLLSVAFLTLLERKILSIMGLRLGPNKVSAIGTLQPISDAAKLSSKSMNYGSNMASIFYMFSSSLMLASMLLIWLSVTCYYSVSSIKYCVLMMFCCLVVNSLGSIISGWSTFSKYSLIGSIRTVSQMISYEAAMYTCIFLMFISVSGYSSSLFSIIPGIYISFCAPLFMYFWVPVMLAELNRTPFDFSEGESELVSGFNVEFGSIGFTLIFLSEYGFILAICTFSSIMFFTGISFLMVFAMVFLVVWVRAVLPRYRFDKLMLTSWKTIIPMLTSYLSLYLMILKF